MAIGAITMILANVGLQIYNNWCGSRQNANLQKKREEFERAAHERNTEHMWKLLREGQELTMQLEKEKHDDRLKELQGDLDNLLKEITHEQTIVNWPLKVLPIVMKNQAFGNLLANQEENVAMHVLFARSNYNEFNKMVHPIIEKALELHCNQHWSTKSDHPILFYSGVWDIQRCSMNPNDIQITALQTQLSNLPTLLITPFFRPKEGNLVFHVNMWGVGASKEGPIIVKEIEPKSDEFHFQHLYTNKDDYDHTIGVLNWIVEDLVPYLECLIGYMADTYFWSSAGLAPHLPLLVTNGSINTDGMKYLVSDSREYYDQLLLTSEEKAKENPFFQYNILDLYGGISELWDEDAKKTNLSNIISSYNGRKLGYRKTFDDALSDKDYHPRDLSFLIHIGKYRCHLPTNTQILLTEEIERLNYRTPKCYSRDSFPNYLLCERCERELNIEDVLDSFVDYCKEMNISQLSILICYVNQNEFHFHTYDDEKDYILYYNFPFNYCYKVELVKHQRNINSLFLNGMTKQISCRLNRIGYLKEKINTKYLY